MPHSDQEPVTYALCRPGCPMPMHLPCWASQHQPRPAPPIPPIISPGSAACGAQTGRECTARSKLQAAHDPHARDAAWLQGQQAAECGVRRVAARAAGGACVTLGLQQHVNQRGSAHRKGRRALCVPPGQSAAMRLPSVPHTCSFSVANSWTARARQPHLRQQTPSPPPAGSCRGWHRTAAPSACLCGGERVGQLCMLGPAMHAWDPQRTLS